MSARLLRNTLALALGLLLGAMCAAAYAGDGRLIITNSGTNVGDCAKMADGTTYCGDPSALPKAGEPPKPLDPTQPPSAINPICATASDGTILCSGGPVSATANLGKIKRPITSYNSPYPACNAAAQDPRAALACACGQAYGAGVTAGTVGTPNNAAETNTGTAPSSCSNGSNYALGVNCASGFSPSNDWKCFQNSTAVPNGVTKWDSNANGGGSITYTGNITNNMTINNIQNITSVGPTPGVSSTTQGGTPSNQSGSTACGSGQSWNGTTCVDQPVQCAAGQTWNGSACVANAQLCPAGQTWNATTKSCSVSTPQNGTQCPSGQYYDGSNCVPSSSAAVTDCTTPPTCSGDAITCAILTQTWKTECPLNQQSDQATLAEQIAAGDDPQANQMPWHPSQQVSHDLQGSISQATFLGSSCPADKPVTMGSYSFSVPFSRWCDVLGYMGLVVMAFSMIAASKIVGVW